MKVLTLLKRASSDFKCMQEYIFVLPGETPAKKNSRITLRNGKTIPSKNYTEWHSMSLRELFSQKKPEEPITSPVSVILSFYHGDLRRRDSDNGTSSIMDLLVDAKILADDNWQIVRQIAVFNYYDKGAPRCRISICQMQEE